MPAGDYGVAWVPIRGSAKFYDGPLPSTGNGGIPSGLYPSTWINQTTGIPFQLGFGWVGSTGADHGLPPGLERLGRVPATGPRAQCGNHRQRQRAASRPAARSTTPCTAGVTSAGGNESDPITMTTTLPGRGDPRIGVWDRVDVSTAGQS